MLRLEARPQISKFWSYASPLLALLVTVATWAFNAAFCAAVRFEALIAACAAEAVDEICAAALETSAAF